MKKLLALSIILFTTNIFSSEHNYTNLSENSSDQNDEENQNYSPEMVVSVLSNAGRFGMRMDTNSIELDEIKKKKREARNNNNLMEFVDLSNQELEKKVKSISNCSLRTNLVILATNIIFWILFYYKSAKSC